MEIKKEQRDNRENVVVILDTPLTTKKKVVKRKGDVRKDKGGDHALPH